MAIRILGSRYLARRIKPSGWRSTAFSTKTVFASNFDPIPEGPYGNLASYILNCMKSYGDKTLVIEAHSGDKRSYKEAHDDILTFSNYLSQEMKYAPGDSVALMAPNHVDYATAVLGVVHMGGVITPINPLYTAQESAHQILNSNAKMVITHPLFVETAVEAAKIAGVEKLIVFGHDSVAPNAVPFEDIRGFQSDISGATAKGSGDDTCVLPYSSGTTGLPKGTMLTHETIVANLLQVDSAEGRVMFDDTTIISPLPLFHIYGFTMSMLYTAFKGATLVTMERFDMEVFARAIQDYKCTRGHLVPPIVLGVIANEQLREKYDLSSLKMVISAAASLGGNLEEEWERVVKCGIKQGWGMSELSPVGTWIPDDALKKGSVGPPLANSEIKCIDVETGADLPLGEEGEFCFKGPQMMKGYLNLPDKTAECLDLETGWMRTGDVAIINPEDGYVTITDRVKELIKYKGFQVAPAELEALLLKHPAVQDTTVIPRADDDAGEVPRAYVVLAPDYEGGEAKAETDIVAFVAENVAPYKKLRGGVVFTDVIPKSASGKILRRFVVDADRKRDD